MPEPVGERGISRYAVCPVFMYVSRGLLTVVEDAGIPSHETGMLETVLCLDDTAWIVGG